MAVSLVLEGRAHVSQSVSLFLWVFWKEVETPRPSLYMQPTKMSSMMIITPTSLFATVLSASNNIIFLLWLHHLDCFLLAGMGWRKRVERGRDGGGGKKNGYVKLKFAVLSPQQPHCFMAA